MAMTALITCVDLTKGGAVASAVDASGNPTGEPIRFNPNRRAYPSLASVKDGPGVVVHVGGVQERGFEQLRWPRVDDLIVLKLNPAKALPKVYTSRWTYKGLFDEECRRLKGVLRWRLVRCFHPLHTRCSVTHLGRSTEQARRDISRNGYRRLLREGTGTLDCILAMDVGPLTAMLPPGWDKCHGPKGCTYALEVESGDLTWVAADWIEPAT